MYRGNRFHARTGDGNNARSKALCRLVRNARTLQGYTALSPPMPSRQVLEMVSPLLMMNRSDDRVRGLRPTIIERRIRLNRSAFSQ